jgi:K+-transporting ATPase ATPase C chain
MNNGKVVGSELIGQKFDSSIYFWSRPSAVGYNPIPSGASNYGPTSDTLKKQVTARRILFAKANSLSDIKAIPNEMIFASGSGLDPHISPNAALMQIGRIVKARKFNEAQKQKLFELVNNMTENPQMIVLGESRINVLKLNIELDKIQ